MIDYKNIVTHEGTKIKVLEAVLADPVPFSCVDRSDVRALGFFNEIGVREMDGWDYSMRDYVKDFGAKYGFDYVSYKVNSHIAGKFIIDPFVVSHNYLSRLNPNVLGDSEEFLLAYFKFFSLDLYVGDVFGEKRYWFSKTDKFALFEEKSLVFSKIDLRERGDVGHRLFVPESKVFPIYSSLFDTFADWSTGNFSDFQEDNLLLSEVSS